MGFIFASKKPETPKLSAEELALAPFIVAARGIVSRDDRQRDHNVGAVYQELAHGRRSIPSYMGV